MSKLELLEKFDKEHNGTYTVDDLAELIVEAYNLGEFDATERVRELHRPVKSWKGREHTEIIGCFECEETGSGREYWVEYPCPTIRALDGEQ